MYLQAPPDSEEDRDLPGAASGDNSEDFDAFSAVQGIDEKVSGSRKRKRRGPGDDDDKLTLATVVATMLDYITKHKATNVAAADIWGFLRTLLPPGNNLGTYYETVRKIVAAHLDNTLERCEQNTTATISVQYVYPVCTRRAQYVYGLCTRCFFFFLSGTIVA